MSTLRVNAIQNTSGVQQYLAQAWVSFLGNGTTGANATVNASGNVSSVFKNATGDYTVNFTNAFADTQYAVAGWCNNTLASSIVVTQNANSTRNTDSFRFATGYATSGGANVDSGATTLIFLR